MVGDYCSGIDGLQTQKGNSNSDHAAGITRWYEIVTQNIETHKTDIFVFARVNSYVVAKLFL